MMGSLALVRRLLWPAVVAVLLLAGWRAHVGFRDLWYSPANRRLATAPRGDIRDAGGAVVAEGPVATRRYPFGDGFAHVAGIIAPGRRGLGQDLAANRWLSTPVRFVPESYFDRRGDGPPDLRLTLEAPWQLAARRALGKRRGAIVVIDVRTGAIVAAVSSPSFDAQAFRSDPASVEAREDGALFDRALRGRYPPASTWKILTAVRLLRSGQANRTHQCTGSYRLGEHEVRCTGRHGRVDLATALRVSCNSYFLEEAMADEASDVVEAGRDLLGTSFRDPGEPLTRFDRGLFTIGQGKAVASPLAMAAAVTALYSDGPPGSSFEARMVAEGPPGQGKALVRIPLLEPDVRKGVRRLLGFAGSSVRRRTSLPPGWALRGAKTGTAQVRGGDDAWLVGVLRNPAGRDFAFAMVIEGIEGTSLNSSPGVLARLVKGVSSGPEVR